MSVTDIAVVRPVSREDVIDVATIAEYVARSRSERTLRRRVVTTLLAVAIITVFAVTLMVGNTIYSPSEVIRVILGDDVQGASFTVGRLRLPRAVLAIAAGA